MKLVDVGMIKTLITEAENLSDYDYCKILDKQGPIRIGGYVFSPSDILQDAAIYDDNGEILNRGQLFEESKEAYIKSTILKLKAQIKAEIDEAFEEDVIF